MMLLRNAVRELLCAPSHLLVWALMLVGSGNPMWAESAHAQASASAHADTSGPWGLGGAYFFGFLASFAFYGAAWAIKARKAHLREANK